MRYVTAADKLSDKKLVERLHELFSTKVALEAALTSALGEYQNRRRGLVRAGKEIGPPLDEPLALDHHTRASMDRRERLAREHHEADEAAQRDPHTRSLLAS